MLYRFMSIKIKKGISPLVAAILLFVITFVLGATVTNWLKSSTDSYMHVADEQQGVLEACTSQLLKITDVRIDDNSDHNESSLIVYIKNDGSIGNATLVDAKAFNTVNVSGCSLNITNKILSVGKTTSAINTSCGSIYFGNSTNKKFDYVIVTSTCSGSQDKFGDSIKEIPTWLD